MMVKMWDVGWFLLGMFVDLLRVCSLYIISRKHFNVFLMIDHGKQKLVSIVIQTKKHYLVLIQSKSNTKVIDSCSNWNILLIKEALSMKQDNKIR